MFSATVTEFVCALRACRIRIAVGHAHAQRAGLNCCGVFHKQ